MALAFDPDLLQRHKTSTNKFISIYIDKERGKGLREGSRKSKTIIANLSFYLRNNWWLWTNRSKVVITLVHSSCNPFN